jgi:hypothetical protein
VQVAVRRVWVSSLMITKDDESISSAKSFPRESSGISEDHDAW